MTTKDTSWYATSPQITCQVILMFLLVLLIHGAVFVCLTGELPKRILCILTNVTTSKQRRLLQDIVKHGHFTCTRGHTGECSTLKIGIMFVVQCLDMERIWCC